MKKGKIGKVYYRELNFTNKRDFRGKYVDGIDESKMRTWNLYRSPVLIEQKKHRPDFYGNTYHDTDKDGEFHKPDFDQQFNMIRTDQIIDWSDVVGADTRDKKKVEVFSECFSPTMVFQQVRREELLDVYTSIHQLSFSDEKEVRAMGQKCKNLRDQMLDNKKKALSELESIMDSQISLFEKEVLGRCEKRKELLTNVNNNELEEKIKRADVILSPESTPLRNIIMKCNDALTIVFSYLNTRQLILNISPSCSMFFQIVNKIPLPIEVDQIDLYLYHMNRRLKTLNIRELKIVQKRKERTSKKGLVIDIPMSNYQIFPKLKKLTELSTIFTNHQHQLRELHVLFELSGPKFSITDKCFSQHEEKHFDDNLVFYDQIGECCRQLECLFLTDHLPKNMTNLKHLRTLHFKSGNHLSIREVESLRNYFSIERPFLTDLKIVDYIEGDNRYSDYETKFILRLMNLQKDIFEMIPSSCTNLQSILINLHFGIHSYNQTIIEYLSKLKNVKLVYRGFVKHDLESNLLGGDGADDPRTPIRNKTLRCEPKLRFLAEKMEQNRSERHESNECFVIQSTPNYMGEVDVDEDDNTKTSIEFELNFMRILMSIPYTCHHIIFEPRSSTESLISFLSYCSNYHDKLSSIRCRSIYFDSIDFEITTLQGFHVWGQSHTDREYTDKAEKTSTLFKDVIQRFFRRFEELEDLRFRFLLSSRTSSLSISNWFFFRDILETLSHYYEESGIAVNPKLKVIDLEISGYYEEESKFLPPSENSPLSIIQNVFESVTKFIKKTKDQTNVEKLGIKFVSKYTDPSSFTNYGLTFSNNRPFGSQRDHFFGGNQRIEERLDDGSRRVSDCMKDGHTKLLECVKETLCSSPTGIQEFRFEMEFLKKWSVCLLVKDGEIKVNEILIV